MSAYDPKRDDFGVTRVADAQKASGDDAMLIYDIKTAYRLYAEEISPTAIPPAPTVIPQPSGAWPVGARRPSCSRRKRHGGSRPTWRSCRNY